MYAHIRKSLADVTDNLASVDTPKAQTGTALFKNITTYNFCQCKYTRR